jgi:hypothetical protein
MEESSTDAAGSKHIPDDWVDAAVLPAPVMAVSDTLRRKPEAPGACDRRDAGGEAGGRVCN